MRSLAMRVDTIPRFQRFRVEVGGRLQSYRQLVQAVGNESKRVPVRGWLRRFSGLASIPQGRSELPARIARLSPTPAHDVTHVALLARGSMRLRKARRAKRPKAKCLFASDSIIAASQHMSTAAAPLSSRLYYLPPTFFRAAKKRSTTELTGTTETNTDGLLSMTSVASVVRCLLDCGSAALGYFGLAGLEGVRLTDNLRCEA
jgi:hypothetical protein